MTNKITAMMAPSKILNLHWGRATDSFTEPVCLSVVFGWSASGWWPTSEISWIPTGPRDLPLHLWLLILVSTAGTDAAHHSNICIDFYYACKGLLGQTLLHYNQTFCLLWVCLLQWKGWYFTHSVCKKSRKWMPAYVGILAKVLFVS